MFEAGSTENFDVNWNERAEAAYLHWTKSDPINQIQLAFRNHWEVFNSIDEFKKINQLPAKRSLEVGCGRGSLSAYFSDAGWDTHLLDISPSAVKLAKRAFEREVLPASFHVGDCLSMNFDSDQFDVVFSVGLLEHFSDTASVISEQVRVLNSGGLFLAYVVPDYALTNIQKDFEWFNEILKSVHPLEKNQKKEVYRTDKGSVEYIKLMQESGLKDIRSHGMYPLPMISNSPSFPFTLLSPPAERVLVHKFQEILRERASKSSQHPWICDEGFGQAFLLIGVKV